MKTELPWYRVMLCRLTLVVADTLFFVAVGDPPTRWQH